MVCDEPGLGWGWGWGDVVDSPTDTSYSYTVLCRFGELYVLVLTGLQNKEWTVLKFIDDFYDCMEVQLGQVRALYFVTG